MALRTKELHKTAKGSVGNNEDWWRLVFDTDTKRLYVEHEWAHADVRSGNADKGAKQLTIEEYLSQGGQDAGHQQLTKLIEGLF